MKKVSLQYFVVLFLIVALSGCASTSNKEQSESRPLQAQSILKFSDVPIPVGFKSLAKESYSFESSGVRAAILRYQGKATLEQVVGFYKEQLPMYNWSLLNITEYGDSVMNFEREGESCIVNISPRGSSAIITISLGPKSQLSIKKTKKPLK